MEELNLSTVNLNDTIYFELNKGTLEALGDDPQGLADFIKYHVADYMVDGEKKQLAKMQLWDFMLKFGDKCYWGGQPIIKANNIYFRKENP